MPYHFGLCTTKQARVKYGAPHILHMLGRHWLLGLIAAVAVLSLVSGIQQTFAHPITINSSPKAVEGLRSPPKKGKGFFSGPIKLRYSKKSGLGPDGKRGAQNKPPN